MSNTEQIREHMEVVGTCGGHVGTVDHIEGNSIRLTRSDPVAGGLHHEIPLEWVASVDDKVHLNRTRDEALVDWEDAPLETNL